MKRKLMIQGGIVMAMLLVLAFGIGVGQAYATTGCFLDTNGHWAETFICWMKDNGITTGTGGGNYSPEDPVTRAQMAVFMQKQADVPPSTGNILISADIGNWKFATATAPNLKFLYSSSGVVVERLSTGTDQFYLYPDLPTVLYGKSLMLTGVEFCYSASTNVVLTRVDISHPTNTSGLPTLNMVLSDTTARTDTACRLYALTTPVTLTAEDSVSFHIAIQWLPGGQYFGLYRTTFVLVPTTTTAAPLSAPQTFGTGQ